MICSLENRSLIKISGEDSETFLQSQFSNDITKIKDKQIQINTYCQHQGKIIAILWVFKKKDDYFLSVLTELKALVLSKLNMYKLMSRVQIDDYSNLVYQFGLIKENQEKSIRINESLSILITSELIPSVESNSIWELACIENILPEVHLKMSEKITPQLVNLDIDELGVSFTKGCYPGQEVVARMHYLGKPKRRLFRFSSDCHVVIGDTLEVKGSQSLKSSGQVIQIAKKDNKSQFLATFELKYIKEKIFLNGDENKPVTILHG